jgi:hypothetical protein
MLVSAMLKGQASAKALGLVKEMVSAMVSATELE